MKKKLGEKLLAGIFLPNKIFDETKRVAEKAADRLCWCSRILIKKNRINCLKKLNSLKCAKNSKIIKLAQKFWNGHFKRGFSEGHFTRIKFDPKFFEPCSCVPNEPEYLELCHALEHHKYFFFLRKTSSAFRIRGLTASK